MQAHPAGVLPGPSQAGEGQLQGGGGGMEAEAPGGQMLEQQAADAEPEGIAAGQHDHRFPGIQGLA